MIRCEALTKWYGGFLALDQLDLELQPGDLFGFIGPNGAGKTTTMKILATLLTPTSGRALVGGHDVVESPDAVRRLVGYMPDFFGVYREMRVVEYLAFFAAAYRVPSGERRQVVQDLLTLVELTHKADELVGSLSRGMQQRLGLARALVHDPQVLILDEPASGLDPRARVEVREILKELQSMGKTIILSSHILPELADICNRVGIVSQGRLRAFGSIEEVAATVAPHRVRAQLGAEDDPEAAAALLRGAFAAPVEYEASSSSLLVRPEAGQRVRCEEVAAALVGGGFGLRGLRSETPSLEEIFLRLTEDAASGDAA